MNIHSKDLVRIENICNHEAGHYIAGRELNFITQGISIEVNINGHCGESVIEPRTMGIDNFQKLGEYLRRRIKVLYAGVISESFDKEDCSNYALKEWRTGGGMNDYAKIKELTQTLRNILYPETELESQAQTELDKIDKELFDESIKIVTERRELIRGISSMLLEKVKEYDKKYFLTESEINNVQNIKELYLKE